MNVLALEKFARGSIPCLERTNAARAQGMYSRNPRYKRSQQKSKAALFEGEEEVVL